jgi:hypothetical protein
MKVMQQTWGSLTKLAKDRQEWRKQDNDDENDDQPFGVMIFTNFLLYYVRELSCKFELFWNGGSGEEDFKISFLFKQM